MIENVWKGKKNFQKSPAKFGSLRNRSVLFEKSSEALEKLWNTSVKLQKSSKNFAKWKVF